MFTYVVSSYKYPAQTYRLVKRLRFLSPAARTLVSHDRKAQALDSGIPASMDAAWLPTPQSVVCGDGTCLDSLVAALGSARTGALVVRSELLHYAVWAGNHPLELTEDMLPAALESGRWFARNFAPNSASLAVLDARLAVQPDGDHWWDRGQ